VYYSILTEKSSFLFSLERDRFISRHFVSGTTLLNWFYIILESKQFSIYIINTISNWRISLSKMCHSYNVNLNIKGHIFRFRWIYNYLCNQCLSPLKLWVRTPFARGILDETLCDKVCQWLATCQWCSQDTPVSSTNKTDSHDIIEILVKVALNTINKTTPNRFDCI